MGEDETAGTPTGAAPTGYGTALEGIGAVAPLPVSEVFLEIPADRLYVVLARSAAVHIGAVLQLGITDVTDLRLAVDEACAMFLLHPAFPAAPADPVADAADGQEGVLHGLSCRFEAYPGELRVAVRAPVPPEFAPDTETIGWIMLGALVDELNWKHADGFGTLELIKRIEPATGPAKPAGPAAAA